MHGLNSIGKAKDDTNRRDEKKQRDDPGEIFHVHWSYVSEKHLGTIEALRHSSTTPALEKLILFSWLNASHELVYQLASFASTLYLLLAYAYAQMLREVESGRIQQTRHLGRYHFVEGCLPFDRSSVIAVVTNNLCGSVGGNRQM